MDPGRGHDRGLLLFSTFSDELTPDDELAMPSARMMLSLLLQCSFWQDDLYSDDEEVHRACRRG